MSKLSRETNAGGGGQEVELSSTQNETVYNQFPIWFHKKLHLTTSSVGTRLGFQHFTALSGIFSSLTEDCWSQNSVDSLFFFLNCHLSFLTLLP